MGFLQTFFLDKYFLSLISEKTFILVQSLKEIHSFFHCLTQDTLGDPTLIKLIFDTCEWKISYFLTFYC